MLIQHKQEVMDTAKMKNRILPVMVVPILLGSIFGFLLSYSYFNAPIQNLQSDLSRSETRIDDLENSVTNLQSDLSQSETRIAALNSTMQIIESLLGGVQENLTLTQSDLASLSSVVSGITNVTTRLQENITEFTQSLSDLNTRLAELEERLHFKNFQTMAELQDWLGEDNTSEYEYIPEVFDCDDFAFTLMVHGFTSGYKVGTVAVYYADTLWYIYYGGEYYWKVPLPWFAAGYWMFGNHMCNLSFVESSGWVLIEPQTDEVFPLNTYEL